MSGRSLKDAWDSYLAGRADLPHSPEYDEALRVLDEIVAEGGEITDALNLRWHIHYQRGNVEAALADLSEAIALRPSFGAAYYNRGTVYSHLRQWSRAQADFETALHIAETTQDFGLEDAARMLCRCV